MSKNESAIIQVRIGEVRQLFNSIDPSPFRDRDLDPDCEEFIVSWARELHADRRFKIEIHLEREPVAQDVLEQIPLAVQSHFHREADMQKLRFRRLVREGRTSLAVGLLALAVCTTAATLAPTPALGAFGNVAVESLVIAGWVAMWHPLEVLLYGVWPVRRERRLLQKLANAEVVLTSSAQTPLAA